MGMRYFGTSVQRQEDKKFLMGQGQYVDDIEFVGMLHGAFLRAEIAHARINGIDTSAAREIPGVHAVYTLDDLGDPYPNKPMTTAYASPLLKQTICQHLLAKDEVCFVGQTVALVVAESRHIAEDALSRIVVDYGPLPAVADCRKALDAIWSEISTASSAISTPPSPKQAIPSRWIFTNIAAAVTPWSAAISSPITTRAKTKPPST
jgi:carbon-monoxide dehydrogenase large subunit